MDELVFRRAKKALKLGLEAVSVGNFRFARDRFKESATAMPTAEAFTFWGWMEHRLGNTETAIDLCRQAILRDPEFGNPYNDIGSYLIQQGKLDEAIPWLEKAKSAPRYEPRHFPHLNLARVFMAKEMPVSALKEFEHALALAPGDPGILESIRKIKESLN